MDNDADIAKLSLIFARIGVGSILVAQCSHMTEPSGPLWLLFFTVSMSSFLASVILFFRSRSQGTYGNVNPAPGFSGSYDLQETRRRLHTQRLLHPSTHLDEGCDAMGWVQRICLVIMVGSLIVVFWVVRILPTSPEEQYPIMKAAMALAAIGSLLMAPCSLRQIFQARRVGQQLAVTEYLSSLLGMLCLLTIGIFFLFCSIYL